MKDLRTNTLNSTSILQRTIKFAEGYQVNEETVKEMLDRMGVDPTPEMVQEGIGFLSANGMEFNMSGLYEFLKSKHIMSVRDMRKGKTTIAVKDLRK